MKIRGRLLLINTLVAFGLGLVTVVSIITERTVTKYNQLSFQGLSIKSEFISFASKGKDLLFTSNLKSGLDAWTQAFELFEEQYIDFTKAPVFIDLIENSEKKDVFSSFDFLWNATKQQLNTLRNTTETLVERHGTGGTNVQGLLYGFQSYGDQNFIPAISSVLKFSETVESSLIPKLEELLLAMDTAVIGAEKFMISLNIGVSIFIALVTFLLVLIISNSLHRRISVIGTSMEFLKRKDYTVKIDTRGTDELSEMGRLLNGFIDDLSSIIDGVKRTSAEAAELKNETAGATVESSAAVHQMTASIASISTQIKDFIQNLRHYDQTVREISEAIDSLDQGIQNQASFVERSTSSIEEMNASIGNVASIADKRVEAADRLVEITKSGGDLLDETNLTIAQIVKDIDEIGQIVGIINGIAEQTNILSMNAAIEAAHAGDAGRGFAVVAEEIRKLADSTDSNAKQVSSMIDGITLGINDVLTQSNESKHAFSQVDSEVVSTSKALQEVSSSMRELAQGSRDIMNSMLELTEIAKAVEKDTALMKDQTVQVSKGMNNLEENSSVVMNGIAEIESGTKEINVTMVHVNELQERSAASLDRLLEEISEFKTKE